MKNTKKNYRKNISIHILSLSLSEWETVKDDSFCLLMKFSHKKYLVFIIKKIVK